MQAQAEPIQKQDQFPPNSRPQPQPRLKTLLSKKRLTIDLVILILILVLSIIYSLSKTKSVKPEPQAPLPDQIQQNLNGDWKTYTNEEYQFSLEYPPDWEISEVSYPQTASSSDIFEIYLGPLSNHGDTARFMRIVEDMSVEEVIQDLTVVSKWASGHGGPVNEITSLNDIYFSGYPAKSLTYRSEQTDTVGGIKLTDEFHQIIFTKDKLTYILSWHEDRNAESVNRILATFKFRQQDCPQGQVISQCKLGPCCCPLNAYCD